MPPGGFMPTRRLCVGSSKHAAMQWHLWTLQVGREGISGAGVLVISPCSGRDGGTDCVVLVKDHTRMYNDLGGKIDHPSLSCPSTASREAYEESCTTVVVPLADLDTCPHIDVGTFHAYRCYVWRSPSPVSVTEYLAATDRARAERWERKYRETTAMAHFPVGSIKTAMAENNGSLPAHLVDKRGVTHAIHGRARRVIERAVERAFL